MILFRASIHDGKFLVIVKTKFGFGECYIVSGVKSNRR